MKKIILFATALLSSHVYSQFNLSPDDWTIPVMENYASSLDQLNGTNYSLVDMNGDGKPDLVDAQDNNTGVVWVTGGNVPYWKVYINNGAGFNTSAQNWTIPVMENYGDYLDQTSSTNYTLVDVNGDNMPDLVDAQDNNTGVVWVTGGNVPYWKVYLNNGNGFNTSAQNWTIPIMENYGDYLDQTSTTNYTLVDVDGDNMPDLVDAQDNNTGVVWVTGGNVPYWKVYINNGSGFNTSAQNWTIPVMENYGDYLDQTSNTNYTLVDVNGDNKPDLVDAQDNNTGVVWVTGSNVPYWKVYINSGSAFSTSAQNWTIPVMENYGDYLDQTSNTNYSLIDVNGDNKPDLIDAQDNATAEAWVTGGNVPYWKIYLNTGTSFVLTAEDWTIPVAENYASLLDQVSASNYGLVDMDGDQMIDFVDAQDNGTGEVWVTGSNVPYWKVYLNTLENTSAIAKHESEEDFLVYPNPTSGFVNIKHPSDEASVIKVYDNLGKLVYQKQIAQGVQNYEVDLSNQVSGLYIIQVLSKENIYTSKVIKE